MPKATVRPHSRRSTTTETKSTRDGGGKWTDDDVQQLRELAEGNTPVGLMSMRLGRSEDAIRSKAQAEGISLAPANRPPRTATCRSHQAHPDLMADGWRCAKCDGMDVPAHSRHCELYDEAEGVSQVDWSALHQLQCRPDPRDDDASPATQS